MDLPALRTRINPHSPEGDNTMNLIDPKNVDTADLLSLLRDIGDRLDDIEEATDHLGSGVAALVAAARKRGRKGKRKHSGHPGNGGNRYRQGVQHAATAVLADLDARSSLIPVNDSDDEYDEGCWCCLLRKNGYPRLAEVVNEATP
jgi:hypothetical protein